MDTEFAYEFGRRLRHHLQKANAGTELLRAQMRLARRERFLRPPDDDVAVLSPIGPPYEWAVFTGSTRSLPLGLSSLARFDYRKLTTAHPTLAPILDALIAAEDERAHAVAEARAPEWRVGQVLDELVVLYASRSGALSCDELRWIGAERAIDVARVYNAETDNGFLAALFAGIDRALLQAVGGTGVYGIRPGSALRGFAARLWEPESEECTSLDGLRSVLERELAGAAAAVLWDLRQSSREQGPATPEFTRAIAPFENAVAALSPEELALLESAEVRFTVAHHDLLVRLASSIPRSPSITPRR